MTTLVFEDNKMTDLNGARSAEPAGWRQQMATLETGLLAIEKGGTEFDQELANRAFWALHSLKGSASFFDLTTIRQLAQQLEEALALVRSRQMVPTAERAGILLLAAARLHELIQNLSASNETDIAEPMSALARLCAAARQSNANAHASPIDGSGSRQLRVLLVEDDFASRLLLQSFLSRYGECHIAANGSEAVGAFRNAMQRGESYDLICMDIMMPEMDGREAVRQIRRLETAQGILSTHGAKIIMTTAVDDAREVMSCFAELCDAYLTKPIDLAKLLGQMKAYHLVR